MARYPDGIWRPIGYNGGTYTGGPPKIVHHTTQNTSLDAAIRLFQSKPYASHFLVDERRIVQLIDTDVASRALQNLSGGVQTNRDWAIQIEVVGYAERPKPRATLTNLQALCRWLEKTHDIARIWPAGYPKPATPAGKDPGGHNRDKTIWDNRSGHYGHSQVPENIHWDPAYTAEEVDFIMADVEEPHDDYPEFRPYIVQRGDTLTKIARTYGVSVDDIARWSGLRNPDDIIIGQVLKIGEKK